MSEVALATMSGSHLFTPAGVKLRLLSLSDCKCKKIKWISYYFRRVFINFGMEKSFSVGAWPETDFRKAVTHRDAAGKRSPLI